MHGPLNVTFTGGSLQERLHSCGADQNRSFSPFVCFYARIKYIYSF